MFSAHFEYVQKNVPLFNNKFGTKGGLVNKILE